MSRRQGNGAHLLGGIADTYKLRMTRPTQLNDVVNGRIAGSTPEDFLNKVGALYGLVWHFTDGTLHVSRKANLASITLSLPEGFPIQYLRKALLDAGVLETKFGWGELPDANKVVLYGPPQYRDIIKRRVAQLRQPDGPGEEVYVLAFSNMPVRSTTLQLGERSVEMPGAADLLRQVLLDAKSGGRTPAAPQAPGLVSSAAVRNMVGDASTAGGVSVPLIASVTEDAKNNAVIVRGRAGQNDLLTRLVRNIDRPAESVDIDVAVVDLDVDALRNSPAATQLFNLASLSPRRTQDLAQLLTEMEVAGSARVVTRQSLRTVTSAPARLRFSDRVSTGSDEPTGEKDGPSPAVDSSVSIDALPVVLGRDELQLDLALQSVQVRVTETPALSPLPGDEGAARERKGEWQSTNTLRLREGASAIVAGNTYEVQRTAAPAGASGAAGQKWYVLMQRYFLVAARRIP